jgi:hypothetical protein
MLCELSQESKHCDKLLLTVSWIWRKIWEAGMLLHNVQDWMLALYISTEVIFCA